MAHLSSLVGALNGMLQRLEHAFGVQGEFVADAAHELRTPIMALAVHVELAQNASDAGEHDAALIQASAASTAWTDLPNSC